jgi:predicted component of type VI protein secretion system
MTHSEFSHILGSINGLSPEQMRQLRRELDSKLAASESTLPARRSAEAGRDTAAHLTAAPKTILEMVDELRQRVPAEEWAKLPKDGAKQLDHYIYKTPKRPIA